MIRWTSAVVGTDGASPRIATASHTSNSPLDGRLRGPTHILRECPGSGAHRRTKLSRLELEPPTAFGVDRRARVGSVADYDRRRSWRSDHAGLTRAPGSRNDERLPWSLPGGLLGDQSPGLVRRGR